MNPYQQMKKGIIVVSVLSIFISQTIFAATLYITPPTSTVSVGSTFSVIVKTDTKGQPVNTVESNIVFPSDKLKVVKVSPGSTFPMQTPGSLATTDNTVYFAEGVPSPGYNGGSGIVGKITFKALASGEARIAVSSGTILLNDGQATDAYTGAASSQITIKLVTPKKVIIEPPVAVTESLDVYISSDSHPDSTQLYSNKNISLSWTSSARAQGFSYVLDNSPVTIPNDTVDTTDTSKVFENTNNGTWYFHIKAIDKNGNWGPASHYKILIGTLPTPPVAAIAPMPVAQESFWSSLENIPFFYVFAFSIWILLIAIIILLVVLIKRHNNASNKTAKEIEHLKNDVDRELMHLRRHIHHQLDLIAQNPSVTMSQTKSLRSKLLNSIREVDTEVSDEDEKIIKYIKVNKEE